MNQTSSNLRPSAHPWTALAAIAFVAFTLTIPGIHAADRFWDNSGGTANDWGNVTNWSTVVGGGTTPAAIPGTSDVAIFSATPIQGTAQTVNLNDNRSVQGVNVLSGVTATTTLQGGGSNRNLTNGISGFVNNASVSLTIGSGTAGQNVNLTLAGSQSIAANGSGGITINNTVAGTGSPTLTNNGTGTGYVGMGALQSTVGKIVQNSATSTLGLRGDSSGFGGNVEILKGKVLIGTSQNNLGSASGQVILGGSGSDAATLEINDNQNITYVAKPIVLGTTSGLLKIVLRDESGGSFTHTITGPVSGNNHLTLENQASSGNIDDKLTFTNGALNNAGTITHIGTGSGDLTINSAIGANVTGVIQNSATSKLVLAGNNTYGGNTTISAGTLALSGSGAIGNSANILLAGGATFNVSGLSSQFTMDNAQTLKATGTVSAGAITMTAGKGVVMGASSGLQFTAYNGSQAPLTVNGTGGSLTLAAGNAVTVTPTSQLGAGSYKLIAKSGSATVAGTAPGSVTVNSPGSVGYSYLSISNAELYLVVSAAATYPITYNGNGNTGGTVPADQTKVENVTLVLASNTGNLVKTGHAFVGWNTQADGNGTSYAAGGNYTTNAAATLYAKWVPAYTVTYSGNGNTSGSAPLDGNNYSSNAPVTVLGAGSLGKTGHTFAGWNTAANGFGTSYAPGTMFNITANTTLYAQWTINTYTVTYSGNGNTSGSAPVDGNSYSHNATVTVLGNTGSLGKTNYAFAGWNTAANGWGSGYAPGATFSIIANTTLYAQWAPAPYPELPELNWVPRSDWVNVKTNIPAAVGDGVADDTAALQAAFNAVRQPGSTKSTVYLPPGTYRITSEIYPQYAGHDMAMHLRGHGRSTRIVWDGAVGGRMFRSDSGAYSTYIGAVWDGQGIAARGFMHDTETNGVRETRVLHQHEAFVNFTVEGAGTASGKLDANGDYQVYLEGSEWRDCLFINCGKGFVVWDPNDYLITLDGCEFYDNSYGIWSQSGTFFVRNSHFERSKQADIVNNNDTSECSARRVTSVGSRAFYERAGSSGGTPFTMQDCHISGWTNTSYAVRTTSGARNPILTFDCTFSNAPSASPPISVLGSTPVVHSNNRWSTGGALVGGMTEYVQEVPPGQRGGLIRSAQQRFFKGAAVTPTAVFDAKNYGAVGNGSADDTAAVQATINAARQAGNGAIAYFPDGRYKLTSTVNITGTNYYVGGAGGSYFNAGSVFTWGGNSTGPLFLVADPQNVTMEYLGIWMQGKPASLVAIRQVSNTPQPSRMHYEQVAIFSPTRPGLSASPADLEVVGLAEDSVLTGSGLFARAYWDGRHLFDNCSSSRILLNEVNGNIGVKGTQAGRDGFLGAQLHQGTFVIEDNHSVVASDSYLEQGPQEYAHLRGSASLPEGRVTISSPRLHTWEDRNVGWPDDFIIEDYRGTLASVMARSDSASEPQAVYRFVHTGSSPFNIVCLANSYADAPPTFDTAPEVPLTVLGCWVRGSTSYSIPNVTHANSLLHASQALDHFRELGEHDLELNYGIVLPRHTVTYEANGATSGTAPASQNKVQDVTLMLANNTGNLARTGWLFAGWNTAANGTGTNYAAGGTYTNNAAVTLYAKWTAAPAGTATETFDTAETTSGHGWSGSGNTTGGNDFGWSGTGNVLGAGGEAGGIFARSAAYRTFADTNIGTLSRTNTLRMLGSFKLNNADFDGTFRLGYFKTGAIPNNFLGISISEPSSGGSNPFRGFATVSGTGGASTGVINLTQGTTLTFDLTWTGNANGSGMLSGTLAGQSVNVSVGAGTGTFDAFGLVCGGNGDASTQNTGGCYFDSLTYTTVFTRPTLNITLQGNQIQIAWTPAGGTLESSPVLGTAAVWTPVGKDNPVLLPIPDPTRFFRVVIP